jgi:hypothetical protein
MDFATLQAMMNKDPNSEPDAYPYDPNSGTLTNIGRFALSNLAKDPGVGGVLPVAGAVKAIAGEAPEAAEALSRLGMFGRDVANTTEASNDAMDAALAPGAAAGSGVDAIRAQQAQSRALDFAQRNQVAKQAAQQKALQLLKNQGQ